MKTLSERVIEALHGKTLATAESCTGGGIGAALTSVAGASKVYRGGVISYCNEIKQYVLGVPQEELARCGAVSSPVAESMARGARTLLDADIAVSVTGLAGPAGDEFGNPVGTVFIGYADEKGCFSREFHFSGDRARVRECAVEAALKIILEAQNDR